MSIGAHCGIVGFVGDVRQLIGSRFLLVHSASGWLWKDAVLTTPCTWSAELFVIWRSLLKRKEGRKEGRKKRSQSVWVKPFGKAADLSRLHKQRPDYAVHIAFGADKVQYTHIAIQRRISIKKFHKNIIVHMSPDTSHAQNAPICVIFCPGWTWLPSVGAGLNVLLTGVFEA